MTNLKDFIIDKNFSMGETLPEGDTYFNTEKTQVEEIQTEWEGKQKTRYKLTEGEKTYFVGVKVMDGLKTQIKKGFTKVRVTRGGEGKNTTYTVVGIKE